MAISDVMKSIINKMGAGYPGDPAEELNRLKDAHQFAHNLADVVGSEKYKDTVGVILDGLKDHYEALQYDSDDDRKKSEGLYGVRTLRTIQKKISARIEKGIKAGETIKTIEERNSYGERRKQDRSKR